MLLHGIHLPAVVPLALRAAWRLAQRPVFWGSSCFADLVVGDAGQKGLQKESTLAPEMAASCYISLGRRCLKRLSPPA